jgi:MFS family permease
MTATMNQHASEQTPLLRPSSPHEPIEEPSKSRPGRRSERFIVSVLILAVLTVGTGDELIQPALTRVFESIYCRSYYAQHDPSLIGSDGGDGVAEEFCKNHVIQGEVAMLRGWLITIEAFVMLLVSVPWGYAADVYGRRPIVFLLMLGLFFRAAWIQAVCWFWQTIPIKAVWGAGAFATFGGGSAVITALLFTVLSDVVPEERRASRFFQMAGAAMATQVIGPFGSAVLMKVNPWIPMLLGLALQFIVLLQVLALPETKNYQAEQSSPSDAASDSASSTCSSKTSPWQNLARAAQDSITFLAADMRLLLVVPAFFMHMLMMSRDILLQFVSTRYSLSLSNATYILTFRSASILVLLLLFYPLLNHLLRTKFAILPQSADLYLGRACAVLTSLGFFLIALAPSLPLLIAAMGINTLGSGTHLYLRSLATSLVESHHVARLNTFVSWIDTIGLMAGSPLLAWLFEKGVELDGPWMGMPFLFCAATFAIVAVLLGMVSLGAGGSGLQLSREQQPLNSEDGEGADD